jgi:Na+/phosphate symporter
MCNCLFCLTSGGAQCCAIWSFMSVLFLVFAGIILTTPPVFVKGVSAEQAISGGHNLFVAAGMYVLTFFLAMFMWIHRLKQEKDKLLKEKEAKEILDESNHFNAPLVASEGGVSSASLGLNESTRSSASAPAKKSKKNKSGRVEGVTSL